MRWDRSGRTPLVRAAASRRVFARRLAPALALATALAGGCSSGPPAPDWQVEAQAALRRATQAHLVGDTRIAGVEFERARRELSRTGRADAIALGELTRCAAQAASLELLGTAASGRPGCAAFEPLRTDAGAAAVAYADFLGAPLAPARIALLPPAQQAAAAAGGDAVRREAAVRAIDDPLSRLLAAAIALRDGVAPPGLVAVAVETASAQGWRRPLLAWLTVQLRRAEAAGDAEAAGALRRRIERVGASSAAGSAGAGR